MSGGEAPARGNPFGTGKLLAVVLVGAGAFLLFLYAIGAGWTGDNPMVNTARADSNSLNGFSALKHLLERRGHNVTVASDGTGLDDTWEEELLILTPGYNTEPERLQDAIEQRRYRGPTIVILPKWWIDRLPVQVRGDHPDDWVQLGGGGAGFWFESVPDFEPMALDSGQTTGWNGGGLSGELPNPQNAQAITEVPNKELFPLVTDAEGDILAGYWNRGGWHPDLAEFGGIRFSQGEEDNQDTDQYPLVIVAEPDLFNNYGMADSTRAYAAVQLVEASMDNADMPIVFDMSMLGIGEAENLLTLAFRPPFLAATLCLLAALLVVGWRAFRRFGPPLAEEPALARGKTQLARNGAGLIERARRWHLLGAPYAALVGGRIASALHIREQDLAGREAAIDAALALRGHAGESFSRKAQALREARRVPEIVRAASALRTIERMLVK